MGETASHKDQVVGQFSQQAEGYNKLTKSMAAATDRQAAFRAQIGVRPDDVVLDVCCGTGALALDIAPFVSRVTGFDLTPAMLEQAKTEQAKRHLTNIDWKIGDISNLPFENGAFSLVVCGAAFHHLMDPHAAFGELVRICRPGGRIAVRDVTPPAEKSAMFDRLETLRDPSHTHALTPEELAGLGRDRAVDPPALHAGAAKDLPFDAILAASYPEKCTREDVRQMLWEDALNGEDKWGFAARIAEGKLLVTYPQTTAVWTRQPSSV